MRKGNLGESKEAKERKQKESHSEIERKRRERMKKETEFLQKQLPNYDCKDKLSIFQAGAEQLIRYTDKLGKRQYIINDAEYSKIVLDNFSGFALHVRCRDCMVVWANDRISNILGFDQKSVIGRSLYSLAEPSKETAQIIKENLTLTPVEEHRTTEGELLRRNFILGLRVAPHMSNHTSCVRGSEQSWCRFVEFCGDIAWERSAGPLSPARRQQRVTDTNQFDDPDSGVSSSGGETVLKALCRTLEPASCGPFLGGPSSVGGCEQHIDTPHFTTKHRPDNLRITEVTGQVNRLLGREAKYFIEKDLSEMVPPAEKSHVRRSFQNALKTGSINFMLCLVHVSGEPVRFRAKLTSIQISGKVFCLIGKFLLDSPEEEDEENEEDGDVSEEEERKVVVRHVPQQSVKLNNTPDAVMTSRPKQEPLVAAGRRPLVAEGPISVPQPQQVLPRLPPVGPRADSSLAVGQTPPAVYSATPLCHLITAAAASKHRGSTDDDKLGLPNNTSFKNLLGDSGDILTQQLFDPNYLRDLVKEDVTDLFH